MAYITGTTADIVEAQKSARSSLYGGKKWEEYFLQPTQQYYQTAGEAVQQKTAYDISQAYANYKQQELALLQQQQLGTGFKEQQASALQSQYGQTYSGLKTTELQNLMNIESQYQATVAKEEERLAKQAAQYRKLDQAVQEYFKQYKDRIPGFEDVESFEDLYDIDETGTKTLSERGKLLYEAILKGGDIDTSQYDDTGKRVGEATTYSFDEYLQETDEDLYEMYLNDPDFAGQVIGGSEYGDMRYSDEDLSKASQIQTTQINSKKETELSQKYDYDKSKTPQFSNEEAKTKYLTAYEKYAQGDIAYFANNDSAIVDALQTRFGGNWDARSEMVGDIFTGKHQLHFDIKDKRKVNMDELNKWAKTHNIDVITDGAYGLKLRVNGRRAQDFAEFITSIA